jgi:methylase of polypeptide subunit release factors
VTPDLPETSAAFPPATELRTFADHLRAAGYTGKRLRDLLGITYPDDVGPLNHDLTRERLQGDRSPLATLVRLFFLEIDQPVRAVDRALPGTDTRWLARHALVQHAGAIVRPRVRIDAVGSHYCVADRRFRGFDSGALGLSGQDPVYPPGSDSVLLREVIVPGAASRVLDLCTGTGVQAFAVAGTAERLIAVDRNPRAAAMARFNATLNDVERLEVRVGDLYGPVSGARFDLIVGNPPFVCSPYEQGPGYHAGGPRGDRVLRRLLLGWRRYLAKDGRGYAISHVGLRRGETLEAVAGAWFRGFHGRALVLRLETGRAVDLAAAQALFAIERGLAAYAAEMRRWIEYLRRHRIDRIALVLIAAVHDGVGRVEVVDAHPRVLPVPLTPPPRQRVEGWLAGSGTAE